MILRELITRLGFDADNNAANSHERALQKVRGAALAVTAAYSATIGVLATAANQYAETAREIENQSRLANANTTEFQRMAAGAKTFGIEQDKLSDILKDTNDRIGDFVQTGGGPMADFFENIGPKVGVTAESFRNLSGPQALQLYVDSLEKANVSQQDMTFYMEAMASDSTALVPLLRNGGEAMRQMGDDAEQSGALLSESGIKAAAAYRKSVLVLTNMVKGIRNTIMDGLLPVVAETAETFAAWWKINRELVIQNLRSFVEQLAFAIRVLFGIMSQGFRIVDSLVDKFGGWERVLRIVMAAVLGFIALKLGGVLWAIAGALTGAGAGARILRGALLALSRLPIIALIVGLGLAIEDLIVWINGGDSAIGRWLGSWEDFSAKAKVVIDDVIAYIQPLIDMFHAITEIIAGVFTLDAARILQGFNDLGDSLTVWAMQVGGDMADFLLDMVPSVDEVMAGMRAIGASMLNWAKDMGARMARLLLPEWAQDAIGLNDVPEPPPAPAPSGTNQAPGELVLPEGGAANVPPVSTNRAPDALVLPGDTVITDNRNQSSSNTIINEWVKNQEQNTNNNTTINEWVESQERNRAPDALTVPTPAEQAQRTNEQLAGAFNTPTPESVRENVTNSTTNSRNVTVNARIDSTLQVPQGTPAEQSAALRREAEATFSELFNREINRTLNDMPEVD